nr:MAG TPA: hypothetical protein [Caudoviricetes sp.]
MMACVTGAGRNAPPGASREPVGNVGNRRHDSIEAF